MAFGFFSGRFARCALALATLSGYAYEAPDFLGPSSGSSSKQGDKRMGVTPSEQKKGPGAIARAGPDWLCANWWFQISDIDFRHKKGATADRRAPQVLELNGISAATISM